MLSSKSIVAVLALRFVATELIPGISFNDTLISASHDMQCISGIEKFVFVILLIMKKIKVLFVPVP